MPVIQPIHAKTILNKTKQRDAWFLDDYTVNPYSGCSFNCLYCYVRGSKYGENMALKTSAKVNAPELLDKALYLRAKKQQYGFIVLSSSTDPYLHFEEKELLSRELLNIILKHRFPVHIITKSHKVTRDYDLLKQIDEQAILPNDLKKKLKGGTLVSFSFSTLDEKVASVFEPGAPSPQHRLRAIDEALQLGLHTGVSLMPLLPYISDTTESLHLFFRTFKELKVKYLLGAGLTLFGSQPSDSKSLVFRAINKHYPNLIGRYEKLFRASYQLPEYYRKAFDQKIKELCVEYQIPDRIVSYEEGYSTS